MHPKTIANFQTLKKSKQTYRKENAMGLPNINIKFSQVASTAIQRSGKGVVGLILKDATAETNAVEYTLASQASTADWTSANLRYIEEAFAGGCTKVVAFRVDTAVTEITDLLKSKKLNWIASPETSLQAGIVTHVKDANATTPGRKVKAVVFAQTADDKHIVNFTNTKVKRKNAGAEEDGVTYCPRLAGVLAGLPFTRSATYYVLSDIDYVTESANPDTDIDAGKFIIINDYGEPKIARAVNSLTTLGTGENETLKSITTVEAMDLILEDITTTFKSTYIGKYKNKLSNQMLFVSALNQYFKALANDDILDPEFDNHAEIDVEAQRTAWIDAGKAEAADWDEITVKKNTYRTKIFLTGSVKILDAIEDLTFEIALA